MHEWDINEFPLRLFQVKGLEKQADLLVADTSTYRLSRTEAWRETMAQASGFSALEAVQASLQKLKGSFVVSGDGSPDPMKIVTLRGKKLVQLTEDISAEKPLLIFPFTTNSRFMKKADGLFGATNLRAVPSAEEVLCFTSCFVDPAGEEDNEQRAEGKGKRKKEPVVEPYWLVKKVAAEGNMELSSVDVVPGYGVRLQGSTQVTAAGGTTKIPCLRSVGALPAGTTLSVFCPQVAAKKAKKAA